jgi:amino acid adenylation domain-containing protein
VLSESQHKALTARLRRGRESAVSEIPRRDPGRTDLPLSYGQEQLWFLDRFVPGVAAYNLPFSLGLSGPLDAAALSRALDALVARHEALRTRLAAGPAGRPVQVIDPPAPVPMPLMDLGDLAPDQRLAQVREFIDAEALRPFSLADGPLLRAQLIRFAEFDHVLLVFVHHTVFDGWSAGVFVRELAALYGQEAAGEPAGLTELPVQFADYALWERDRLTGSVLDELEAYWRQVMAGYETVQLPTDRPRPLLDSFAGARAELLLPDPALLDGLRELSRREGTTLFVTLMAVFQVLLHRYTGQTDLVVGTASANRGRRELAPLIGFLVNTLPIRADLSGDPPFTELLARVKDATIGAYAHQDLPFGKLVQTLDVERDPSRAPVFQIAMTYADRNATPAHAAGLDIAVTDLAVGIDAAKFDLNLLIESRGAQLWVEASYPPALFDAGTIHRLLGHLEVLLRGVVADPSARLSALPVLTEAEVRRELTEWNDTARVFPVTCIHEGFEEQVRRDPGALAAEFEGESWSYAELNARANAIARRLRAAGAGPEVLVGVCLPTSLERLAVLLGIWKAGGGYVPLDPALPPERLAFLVADTAMPVVVTDTASGAGLPEGVTRVVLDDPAERARINGASPAGKTPDGVADGDLSGIGVVPSNVAYVIYTSGSTGEPKGVVVEHRQALNFLLGMAEHWRIGPGTAVLSFAAFTFDVSVMDMFMPLLGGARVVMASPDTLHSPPRLAELIRGAGVTFACLPPAVLSLLVNEDFPGLRTLLSAGSELSSDLLRAWLRPGLEIYNGYGPTEASIGATFMRMDERTQLPPPIGRPKPNYQVYVLDGYLNPVPPGVIGELHIGGAGVARGYLNRPELTNERFIPDPFRPGGRLYKTGDLVRRRPDGTIGFVGRADDQVKIRGLRVELGEIEAALTACPGVAQAVVTVITDPAGEKQLAAYVRLAPGGATLPGELRASLAERLPAYMVPGYLMILDEFPLTKHGKIDKAALPEPQPIGEGGERVPPATLIETVLVDMYVTLLSRQDIGAVDSFFDLGGSSLQAMQLVTTLQDELEVDVDVAEVFLSPSPRQLAALLRDKHGFEDEELDAAARQS